MNLLLSRSSRSLLWRSGFNYPGTKKSILAHSERCDIGPSYVSGHVTSIGQEKGVQHIYILAASLSSLKLKPSSAKTNSNLNYFCTVCCRIMLLEERARSCDATFCHVTMT